jgi:hypothetical protein
MPDTYTKLSERAAPDLVAVRKSTSIRNISIERAKSAHEDRQMKIYLQTRYQLIASVFVVFLWLGIGATFYSFFYGWPWLTALYYSAQAGLSIGFGALPETSDVSRFYTVLHVLAGSSFIAGSLGMFVTNTLEKTNMDWEAMMNKEVAKELQVEGGNVSVDIDTFYKRNRAFILTTAISILWMAMGVAYGCFYEGYTIIQAIYFAITACSTAGLQAPSVDLESNNVWMLYVAVFITVGVPVYGMVLGQAANLLVADYIQGQTERALTQHMDEAQLEFALSFQEQKGSKKAHKIEYADFLAFSCIRLGLMDVDMVKAIKEQYHELDVDNSGYLELTEIKAAMKFAEFDVEHDGALQVQDFLLLWDKEILSDAFDYLPMLFKQGAAERVFDDINEGRHDDQVTRVEFVGFWNFITNKEVASKWFEEHGDDWLDNKIRLPALVETYDHDSGTMTYTIDGKTTTVSTTPEQSLKYKEIIFFRRWAAGEGADWMAANKDAWIAGETKLPDAALFCKSGVKHDN